MSGPRAAERLGQAAFRQFITVGADSLTMEAIAERAGVSIGAAYRWQPSLEAAVAEALRMGLPPLAGQLAESSSLERWLQPQALEDRLLAEGLLAIRRFPSVAPLVQQAVQAISRGLDPLGVAVLVGSQAVMLAGCMMPTAGRRALAQLYGRMRSCDPDGLLPWPAPATPGDFPAEVSSPDPVDLDRLGQRLVAATAAVLASAAQTTVRSIADTAGLTTGAIYRRYESKEQLVADTIRSHLTADRTLWAVPFVARLAGTEPGDPAEILAASLALAADAHAESTRLSVEFLAASRVSPDARQALVQRILAAQQSRQDLFDSMLLAGIFTRTDTPAALSWALQVTPTGARVLGLAIPQPTAGEWQPFMARLLRSL